MDTKVTPQTRAESNSPPAGPPKQGDPNWDPGKVVIREGRSAIRLFVLLGILALVVGAYSYDYFIMRPDTLKADKDIQSLVDERNKKGVKDADLVRSKDVQAVVGFPPTHVEDKKDHTIEYYCWWGKTPFLSKRRNYISVVYVGDEPRRFSTHHLNSKPEEENLPLDNSKPPTIEMPSESGEGTDKAVSGEAPDSDTPEPSAAEPGSEKATTDAPTGDKSSDEKSAEAKAETTPKTKAGDSEGKKLTDLLEKDSGDKDAPERNSGDKEKEKSLE